MKYKIIYDREACIGAAACAAVCPEFWEMQSDGKAKLKGSKEIKSEIFELLLSGADSEKLKKKLECNKSAATSCPVNAIKIFDDQDKQIV